MSCGEYNTANGIVVWSSRAFDKLLQLLREEYLHRIGEAAPTSPGIEIVTAYWPRVFIGTASLRHDRGNSYCSWHTDG